MTGLTGGHCSGVGGWARAASLRGEILELVWGSDSFAWVIPRHLGRRGTKEM